MTSKKEQLKMTIHELMLDGASDVEISEVIGEQSAAAVRRLKAQFGLAGLKKWACPNCGFEMLSKEQPRCKRHSVHIVPFEDYRRSLQEDGFAMVEVTDG